MSTGTLSSVLLPLNKTDSPTLRSAPSCLTLPDDDKENTSYPSPVNTNKKARSSLPMDHTYQHVELTPRPHLSKKRRQHYDPPENLSSASTPSDDNTSELEWHHTGCASPTKQLAVLEDSSEPVNYCDFASTQPCLYTMRRGSSSWRWHWHTWFDDGLEGLTSTSTTVDHWDRKRFSHAWANNRIERLKTGTMVPLEKVQDLVTTAVLHEDSRAHETAWNEDVHKVVIASALTASVYTEYLAIANVKSTSIEPPELACQKLFKREVDYAIVLPPSQRIQKARKMLKPVANAGHKSWNHTTSNSVRSMPIASNMETKALDKSWTDGTAQIAIWTAALLKRLALLQQYGQGRLKIPAMPLIIAPKVMIGLSSSSYSTSTRS
ncbi:MAG: hypothetical protein Q9180_004204 [Flavoplaca navasiana]